MDLDIVNEKLISRIKPLSYPLAIKLYTSPVQVPEMAKTAQDVFGAREMLCKFTAVARRYGWIMPRSLSENSLLAKKFSLRILPQKVYGKVFSPDRTKSSVK